MNEQTKCVALSLSLAVSLSLAGSEASAAAFVQKPAMLSSARSLGNNAVLSSKEVLLAKVAEAKGADPKAFDAVRAIQEKASMKRMDGDPRRKAMVVRSLKALGPSGLWAMLDSMVDTDWFAKQTADVQSATIEAVGALREPVALPVLAGMLRNRASAPPVVAASAAALGKLGSDEATTIVVSEFKARGTGNVALVSALGQCRRELAAKELARVLSDPANDDIAIAAAEGLGALASTWAWKTSSLVSHSERSQVQRTAATALAKAFANGSADVRTAAEASLLVVDKQEAVVAIEVAKSKADATTGAALDALAARVRRAAL